MAEFLQAFVPTLAFMLVPIAIPVVAVAVGAISDRLSRESQAESVEDRLRALAAEREAARGLAQAA